MTLEEVQAADMPSWIQRAQIASVEIEKLKQQLATEKESVSEMSTELQILKGELENNRCESERLTAMKRGVDDRSYMQPRAELLDLEDAENVIAELKDELAYKISVNRSLALQLEKTIESNSELLLEIKDLDDLLQSRDREIERLRAADTVKLGFEEEKASWMKRLEESESVIKELRLSIDELSGNQETMRSNEVETAAEQLRKELAKAEAESDEVRQENMSLLSQLMNLRHQTDEKDTQIQRLESELAAFQDQEKKLKELQCTVNDLRDKLYQSEELSESQLESNKVFLVELNSTVEMLQKQKEELEVMLKKSEDDNSSLCLELTVLRKDAQEHEKERSLLVSLRGQMKTSREKLTVVTQNHEAAMKRIEELEAENKVLNEGNSEALTVLKQQIADNEQNLHAAQLKCQGLENESSELQSQLKQKHSEVESLLNAKEAMHASVSALQMANRELQDRVDTFAVNEKNLDSSLKSMKEAHADMQERLRDSEQTVSDASHRLQEANDEIVRLKEDLEAAQERVRQSLSGLAEAEGAKSALEQRLGDIVEDKNIRIQDLELQLSHMKRDVDALEESLSASESRVLELQLENGELGDKFCDSVSERKDMGERLEATARREAELDRKVKGMEQELLEIKNETHIYEETMVQLENRLQFLSNESVDQQEKMAAEIERLTASIREMQSEKERAESENASLLQELSIWKAKAEAAEEEVRTWKEKLEADAAQAKQRNIGSSSTTSSEERTTPKGARKGSEVDQKSELTRLRKQAAELKKKHVELTDERDEAKRKLALFQRELQRKSDALALTEKKLRGEQHRPTTKHPSQKADNHKATISTAAPVMSHSAKTMVSLSEKVKSLEEQLNARTVELEATKFLLKKKEEQLFMKSSENGGPEVSDGEHVFETEHCPVQQDPQSGKISETADDSIQSEGNDTLEAENRHLRKLLSQLNQSLQKGSTPNGNVEHDRNEPELVTELNGMKERYSQMSLRFAELRAEKEELIMALKSGRHD